MMFPVIQWLVSQVLESRHSRGDAIRRYATFQFGQNFDVSSQHPVAALTSGFEENYRPKRKFRQKVNCFDNIFPIIE